MNKYTQTIQLYLGKFLTLPSGFRLHYVDEGHGPPVVMLHGNPSWSIYYRQLVTALKKDFRCLVPDQIGCGFSDKPASEAYPFTFAQRLADFEHFIAALELDEPFTLIVHDWGGIIGTTYATRYPEKIARLVVLNTAAFHLPANKAFPWQLWLGRHSKMGAFLIRHFNAFSAIAAHTCCPRKPMSKALRQAYTAPYNTPQNREATLRFVQDIPLSPQDPGYEIISQTEANLHRLKDKPILICWGEKDFVFDPEILRVWENHFPQAEVHRVPEAGHYVLEDADDLVIPWIQNFLNPIAAKVSPL